MNLEHPVSLGDLVRAAGVLYVDDEETLRRIAELLRLDPAVSVRRAATTPTIPADVPEPVVPPTPPPAELPPVHHDPGVAVPTTARAESRWTIAHTTARRAETPWWSDLSPIDPPPSTPEPPALPFEPLLVPHWSRGIIVGTLSTRTDDGPLDVERIVTLLANGRALSRFPQVPRWSMRHGVQVLVDEGEAMAPFARDQEWIVEEISRLAGEATEVLTFTDTPLRVADARGDELDYEPPPPGTAVLLLSDLGIGIAPAAPGRRARWGEFAALLRRSGVVPIALVPYARVRWPRRVFRQFCALVWDRATTAGTATREVRRRR